VDSVKKYGSTSAEKEADNILECRQIVREITTYGVSQPQIIRIIGLLALELENRDQMQQISALLKRLEKGDTSKSTLITEV